MADAVKVQEFDHPYVTADVLIFSIRNGEFSLLLIRRSNDPFAGSFAIPGGFVQMNETLDEAAKRIIDQKGHQKNLYLEQLYTFGDLNRDPRGRVVSVAYIALVPEDKAVDVDDGKHLIKWFAVKDLPPLAFDHAKIVASAIERIKSKIGYSNIAANLLPNKFRLTQLQNVYEMILDKKLDKRNFRKKMSSLDLLESLDEKAVTGQHRPAMLYHFREKGLIIFN